MKEFTENDALEILKNGNTKAEKILNDKEKMNEFLKRLENNLNNTTLEGEKFQKIPELIELLKRYVDYEYTEISQKSITTIICTLLYWLAPIDVIPDTTPGIGYDDDNMIMDTCLKQIGIELKEYQEWKELNSL